MSTVSDYQSYANATQRIKDSYESELAQARSNHNREVEKIKEEYDETLTSKKEDYQEELTKERKAARDEISKLKDEMYGAKGTRLSEEMQRTAEQRKQLMDYQEQAAQEANRKAKRVEASTSGRLEQAVKAANETTERALASQKKSHQAEMNRVNEELTMYRSEGRDVPAEKAKAREAVIREYEGEHLKEKERISEAYETTFEHLKDHQEMAEKHYGSQLAQQGIMANERARTLVRKQKEEFSKEFENQKAEHDRIVNYHEQTLKNEKLKNASVQSKIIQRSAKNGERALKDKDRVYQEYFNTNNQKVTHELNEKQQKIYELSTTSDPLKVSPGVVERIQKNELERSTKERDAERKGHLNNLDAVQARANQDRLEMNLDFKNQTSELSRNMRKESDLDKRNFTNTFQDFKNYHDLSITGEKERARDSISRLQGRHSVELAGEQKRTIEALNTQADDLTYDKNRTVDELNTAQRNKDREWMFKTNDMRRDYENKMAEQRDLHERLLTEHKLESDKKFRELERNTKRILDEKERAHTHQMKQMEMAYKEKERFLTEQQKEEIDRMKRAQAQMALKRG